jgi:hypothetical protein
MSAGQSQRQNGRIDGTCWVLPGRVPRVPAHLRQTLEAAHRPPCSPASTHWTLARWASGS